MELRQLEAFVSLAAELHFGRAAEKLYLGQPTLSDLIRRLERELGTPLFTRTTRRVTLTEAGVELLRYSKTILDDVAAATAAVRRIAGGEGGTVRVGITPPVAPRLFPHLRDGFADVAPGIAVEASLLWLPSLVAAVAEGSIDVAITCGPLADQDGLATEVFCNEPLLVGLRPEHRLAARAEVDLADLAADVLGTPASTLFPAWANVVRTVLRERAIRPPELPLTATELAATRWLDQSGIDWIMLIGSLAAGHTGTAIRPVTPAYAVPFVLQWNPARAQSAAVARFVRHALTAAPPAGWAPGPAHFGALDG